MLILNTGGTFNKRYDPIRGELFVPRDNVAVEKILSTMNDSIACEGIIYKDSLEMDDDDRAFLANTIAQSDESHIIVIHGTDTMDQSARSVASLELGKVVVFTGAMVPFSIEPIEATANLAMAIGYAKLAGEGVYIAMQGIAGAYTDIVKNRSAGKFEYV